jgi:hypothetical protein
MPEAVVCDLCGREIDLHESYVVQIEVFAEPSMKPATAEELAGIDFDATYSELLDQMKHMTADDLQDDVHRRFEYRMCRPCQRRFLANPLGKPRDVPAGHN